MEMALCELDGKMAHIFPRSTRIMKKLRKFEWWENYAKPKQILLIILIISVVVVIFYLFSWQNGSNRHTFPRFWRSEPYYSFDNFIYKDARDIKFKGEKLVHIDLKGAPPKIGYFEKLFPLLAKLGATGLLIEYEDMFPYSEPLLGNISALNAYTLDEIKTILKYAEESHLTVIPLIQTFGHMEFLLKLKEFQELREIPEYPQVICPTHHKTLNIISEMVRQIISAHPKSTKIHIGADEVYYIGMCERCVNVMNKFGWMKNELFLEHVNAIANNIRNKYPRVRVLMWDDQFRGMTSKELKSSHISNLIEPVVWKYTKDVYEDLGPSLWDLYADIFPKVWIASAFKGATGSNQYITDITHHLQNHRSWMSIVTEYKHRIKFEGIFITGWQRYDHFAILCELLPVAVPSLAMSLRLLLGYDESPLSPPTEIAKILQCEQPYGLIGPNFGSPKCAYPGGEVLEVVLRFHQLKDDYAHILDDSRVKGWMHDYNIAHGYSNPQYVESGTVSLSSLRTELMQLEIEIVIAMQEAYDNYTVVEWTDTFIKPFATKVYELWDAREKLLAKQYWPRRPLIENPSNEL